MARPSRMITTLLFAVTLGIGFTPTVQAQPAQPPAAASTPADNNADYVAPGREDLEPAEPGFDDNNIDNQAGKNWHPTANPKSKVTPGQMRSDKEEIPGGFTKEQANRAEVQEAKEQATQARSGIQTFAVVDTCRTYWPSPFKVCGKIREKYDSLGGPQSFLTWPKSDELKVPDGVGRRNEFVNGFIYWHPNTGAHPITTHFSVAWARTGWERGPLGYPTTDEFGLSDGIGRKQSFEHGHIYGSLAGLATIHGAIYDKWIQTGAEKGSLSYPIGDELGTPDGVGRYNKFAGGMIYWSPTTGAHEVQSLTLSLWATEGYEKGKYGYPVSQEYLNGNGEIVQHFQKGTLNLTRALRSAKSSIYRGKSINSILAASLSGDVYAKSSGVVNHSDPSFSFAKYDEGDNPGDYGGVDIPEDYQYESGPFADDLHDYCSYSPDSWQQTDGPNANFKGACARHDMCYERNDGNDDGKKNCNRIFKDDLITVCDNVFNNGALRHQPCIGAARKYYEAVVASHPTQWDEHATR